MELTTSRAGISQAVVIADIGKKTFRNAFENSFNSKKELEEYLEYTYDAAKLVKSILKENNVYVIAWINGVAGGFAKIKKQSINRHIKAVFQSELQKIYVLPDYQATGVGSVLMNEIKRLAYETGADYVWLDVHTSNEKATRFYEKNGFKKRGKHFFTIGTQTFEYHVLAKPVKVMEENED